MTPGGCPPEEEGEDRTRSPADSWARGLRSGLHAGRRSGKWSGTPSSATRRLAPRGLDRPPATPARRASAVRARVPGRPLRERGRHALRSWSAKAPALSFGRMENRRFDMYAVDWKWGFFSNLREVGRGVGRR